MLQLVKDPNVKGISRTGLQQKRGQTVFGIVFITQPKNGFFKIASQGDDGFADDLRVPVDRTDLPGKPKSSQFAGGRRVNITSAIWMSLEKTGRNSFSLRSLNSRTQDSRLRFTPGEQREFFGSQNGSDAHRDRVPGHICFTPEITCRVSAG